MTVPGPSGRSLSVSVTEMFGQDLLSLLLTPFCEARSWKLGIFPSLFCPMPLHRALWSKGRSGPRTPGPSARLLQRRICRTGSALPDPGASLPARWHWQREEPVGNVRAQP